MGDRARDAFTIPEIKEENSSRRWKFLIGGLMIVALAVFLVVNALGSSGSYYLTVSELKSRAPTLQHRNVRVAGKVIGNTIRWDAADLDLSFTIQDATGKLLVRYHGPRPDNLKDGADAVVEGRLGDDGIFVANNLLLKCPSRYESELQKQNE